MGHKYRAVKIRTGRWGGGGGMRGWDRGAALSRVGGSCLDGWAD